MSTTTTTEFYCAQHSLSNCDECADLLAACYFCDAPTDTYMVDEDEQVGYRGRLYYCAAHEHLAIEATGS